MLTYNVKCTNEKCEDYSIVINVTHRISENHPNCEKCENKLETVFLSGQIGQTQYIGKWFKNQGEY